MGYFEQYISVKVARQVLYIFMYYASTTVAVWQSLSGIDCVTFNVGCPVKQTMLKTMMAVKLILCGSFVIVFQQVNSDILLAEISSPMSGIDRCREICEKTYSLTSNSVSLQEHE